MVRCFIALDLSREAINEIKGIQDLIRKKTLALGKYTDPENLHLTLKFLGEIDEGTVENVKKRLNDVKINCLDAEIGEIGIFSRKFPKIVWVKLKGKGIFDLQKEIDSRLNDLFKSEGRFMSHITIARVRNIGDKKDFLEYLESIKPSRIKFKVDRFFLKKSELKPDGPVYTDMEEYKFN